MITQTAAPGLTGFLTEAQGYINAARGVLADGRDASVERLREVRTQLDILCGAAEMLELDELAALAAPAGSLMSSLIGEPDGASSDADPGQAMSDLLARIDDYIRNQIGEAAAAAPAAPTALVSPVSSDLPPDLLNIFAMEAQEHCQAIQSGLEAVRTGSGGPAVLSEVRRATHTLKGAAASMGFTGTARLAHLMEELIEQRLDSGSQLPAEELNLLFDSADALQNLLEPEGGSDVDAMLEQIDGRYAASLGAAYLPPETSGSPLPIDEASILPQTRPADSIIRLPKSAVDALINRLGEVLINRASLEEQLGSLRNLSNELSHTSVRLQQVSQDIDLQIDSLPHVHQRWPGHSDPAFDPLELDRYTGLHQLARELGEIAADTSNIDGHLNFLAEDLAGTVARERRLTGELQEGLLGTRLVAFRDLETRLRRTVQRTARDLGKPVEMVLSGLETRIDKAILDALADPLMHLLRNAVDHGIETAAQRAALLKPPMGTITLSVRREYGRVVVTLSDDGAGINLPQVRQRARALGLWQDDLPAGEQHLLDLLFREGFTTVDVATQTSGRGVGLDIVRRAVSELQGTVRVHTEAGQGTTFILAVPITLAITRALYIRSCGHTFAVPLEHISSILKPLPEELEEIRLHGTLHHAERALSLYHLSAFVSSAEREHRDEKFALILDSGNQAVAVLVDALAGTHEAVIKPLGSHLRHVHGISGATIAGDGRVVLILNLPEIIAGKQSHQQAAEPQSLPSRAKALPHVLVVDDSISVRRVVCSFLERSGWRTSDARDGIEALEKITAARPDAALVDIEMPRMNGFELLARIRSDPTLKDLPVVFLTSRSAAKHRERAAQLQVDGYLVKPYHDAELLAELTRVVQDKSKS